MAPKKEHEEEVVEILHDLQVIENLAKRAGCTYPAASITYLKFDKEVL